MERPAQNLGADVLFGAVTGAFVGAFAHGQAPLSAILEGVFVGAVAGALRRKWEPLIFGQRPALAPPLMAPRVGAIAPYPWYRPSLTYPWSDH